MGPDRKVAFLADPRNHPERPARIRVVETHFAWVFLTGRLAWKLKKPARHADMDYRALGARERGCRAELRLNQRLAPSVYLSVIPLTSSAGRLRIGGQGRVVDWLVKMRQLRADRMLDRRMQRGSLPAAALAPLAGLLADFYRRADPAPMGARRFVVRLQGQVRTNGAALARLGERIDPVLLDRVIDLQRQFLQRARGLIGARGRRVVEAHGDLRAEHVCLDPLAVIDCLEFERNLRLLDPIEDLALLALEIERAGHSRAATALLRRVAAGIHDTPAFCLVHFYMSHRAVTRAKLAAWHVGDPQYRDPAPWLARAHSFLRDALRHGRQALSGFQLASAGGNRSSSGASGR